MTTIRLPSLLQSLVCVRGRSGSPVGMGLLVGPRTVVTCTHVVAEALGQTGNDLGSRDEPLQIDFPLAKPNTRGGVSARLQAYTPAAREDAALLRLDEDVEDGIQPLRPLMAPDLVGHSFITYSTPPEAPQGIAARGTITAPVGQGRFQLESLEPAGYPVMKGFSGSPVWNVQLDGVVGLVSHVERRGEYRVAFMIPITVVVAVLPPLRTFTLEVGTLAHLEARLAELRSEQDAAADPRRFQEAIAGVQVEIEKWRGGAELQERRVARGLLEERRRLSFSGRRLPEAGAFFKDRVKEQQSMAALLAQDTTRMVSVLGRGGMGKTALVARVIEDLERSRWPRAEDQLPFDGLVCLSTRSSGIVLEKIYLYCGRMLGGKAERHLAQLWVNPAVLLVEKIAALLDLLRKGRYVIVLDNVEDLLDESGRLTDEELNLFLNENLRSGGAQIIVTSRVPMAFSAEVMQFDQQVQLSEGLTVEDGVALLRERDPNGRYGLRDAPAADLERAVRAVHGVPRALEILASIMAQDRHAKLTDITRTFFTREEVVERLVEENYKRLDLKARRVVEALAVLRKPVPEVAIDFLLQPFEPGMDVPGIVEHLTRASMVALDRDSQTVALHPIDQDYVYSQLLGEGTATGKITRRALERRAATYYQQLQLPKPQWRTLADIEPQLSEFTHRVRAGDHSDARQTLAKIDYEALYKWGFYARLIEMHQQLEGHLETAGEQAYHLGSLGLCFFQLGRIDEALATLEAGLLVAQRAGDWWNESICLARLGNVFLSTCEMEKAVSRLEAARSIAHEHGDRRGEAWQLSALGNALLSLGKIDSAIEHFENALSLADHGEDGPDLRGKHHHLDSLGQAFLILGETRKAIEAFEEALEYARKVGGRRGEGRRLASLSRALLQRGDDEGCDQARGHAEHALTVAREIAQPADECEALIGLAAVELAAGQLDAAESRCREALRFEFPQTSYQTWLLMGLVRARQESAESRAAFLESVRRTRQILAKCPDLCEARYGLAVGLAGSALWTEGEAAPRTDQRSLEVAIEELDRAVAHCPARGLRWRAELWFRQLLPIAAVDVEPLLKHVGG